MEKFSTWSFVGFCRFSEKQTHSRTHWPFTQSCWGLCQRTHHPRLPPFTSVSSCLIPLVTHSIIRLQSVSSSSLFMCCSSKSWSEDTLQVCPTMDLPTTTMCACSSSSSSIMAVVLMARSSYQMVLRRWSPSSQALPSPEWIHVTYWSLHKSYQVWSTIYIPWHHSFCCSELKGFGWQQYMKVKDRIATDFTSIIFEVMV